MTDPATAYIFANGQIDDLARLTIAPTPADLLIAADGGAKWCLQLGFTPDVVIGDLDSIASSDLERLKTNRIEIQSFPADKDQTDLELALSLAQERHCRQAYIIGALGGKTDMLLANVFLLLTPIAQGLHTKIIDAHQHIHCLTAGHRLILHGHIGDGVSLLPIGGNAGGITTQGLAFPLIHTTLAVGISRGVSNRLIQSCAHISLSQGALLVIHRLKNQTKSFTGRA